MHIVKPALLYFAIVFGCGFALGVMRTLWLVPAVGTRIAELCELPLMMAISVLAARWVMRRLAVAFDSGPRLAIGALALVLMLAFEFAVVLPLRGMSIAEYFSTRDPVSGSAYSLSLALFALAPWLLALRGRR
jgi:ABC-type uncharacterized transport system permease subunit